ncbi:polymer-forming cytoskeletal protein [Deinococcus metallilatus]|uniref:Polymer-forming cytoskeletal protein n=1 Tax=Deinococcus metallilatus TaxID=1211322 RepID=A0AAJ5JXA4_9DEIO|nr:polymer-forming cytoskeletal protein [Deinococcus metallilatus]MBB5297050.1 hypothetical protein [Deinococcus metallilatus]QBY07822.1 polymer-forming cytoskeletal protein [Deinococcus metallilatus]RXJ13171.1 polymer-forming cytoskeletal protein [Deinococcus metallilatus]TLK23056.1 polymer-forming cytoskeletal protein [Deinococcus metallilatus]GMA16015.1 hypothetical protein GCM10025871_23460 [Deinococcus metallilatus]
MGAKGGESWLDLLHREADGDLTEAERAQLVLLEQDTTFSEVRQHLAHATGALQALRPPGLPHSLAEEVASDIAWSMRLRAAPPAPSSVAARVASEVGLSQRLSLAAGPALPRSVAQDVAAEVRASTWVGAAPVLPRSLAPTVAAEVGWAARLERPSPPLPASAAGPLAARIAREVGGGAATPAPTPARHNPAPLLLVSGLLVGLTLLGITSAWPNLAAGATVLQTLVAQVSPLAGVGLVLLLAVSLLIAWRPTPAVQRLGAGAFALSAVLTLPPLYQAFGRSGVTVGHDVTVHGRVAGNVVALGGNVILARDAQVQGEVITLFGDVRREAGASVAGRVNTLLGHAPGDATALQTAPPTGASLATASAFRPLLGWLGGAAWSRIFVVLTGGMLLLLFVAGAAPVLARRQRHAPLLTLALGVLALALLIGPALGLALAGLLVPALLASAFALLLVATGLSVSAYDAGRAVAYRLRLPAPDALGALLGLGAVAATLSLPPLALTCALVGGAWGTGTLLLTRPGREAES